MYTVCAFGCLAFALSVRLRLCTVLWCVVMVLTQSVSCSKVSFRHFWYFCVGSSVRLQYAAADVESPAVVWWASETALPPPLLRSHNRSSSLPTPRSRRTCPNRMPWTYTATVTCYRQQGDRSRGRSPVWILRACILQWRMMWWCWWGWSGVRDLKSNGGAVGIGWGCRDGVRVGVGVLQTLRD